MGIKKYSLDQTYEVDELIRQLDNLSAELTVTFSLTEIGDKKPGVEATGKFSTAQLVTILKERRVDLHKTSLLDPLTGVLNHDYFYKRIGTIDRSQVLPVAVINININDWKYHNDNYGDDESDRLIKIIANIIKSEAKDEFVIGRIDGDVFGVIIPMATEGEAEFFINKVKDRCLNYEDDILAPSVAAGIIYKTNIEENIEDLLSDAEYAMFEDKFEVKNAPKYLRRLEHGVKGYHPEDK